MADDNVPPPEKRQRRNNDDNDNENELIVASTGALRVARMLEDNVFFRIASFLSPADETALVCKLFLEAAARTSESALYRIQDNLAVDHDWRLRLAKHVLDGYQRFYFNDNPEMLLDQRPPPPTLHPRLLWQSANKIHLKKRVTRHIGPSVVLPNGNIAVACESDNAIRILDTHRMTTWSFAGSLDPQRVPFPSTALIAQRFSVLQHSGFDAETIEDHLRIGGVHVLGLLLQNWNGFSWITDRLYYSNGHLVLHQKPISSLFINCNWVHVWKIEGQGESVSAQHLYTKDVKASANDLDQVAAAADSPPQDGNAKPSPRFQDLVVAANGRMYLLWSLGEGQVDQVVSYEVESGNLLGIQPMQMRTETRIVSSLMVSGNHLLQFRRIEAAGPFPAEYGLGVYSYKMVDDGLELTVFLPCFEGGETWLNRDGSRQIIHKWILYRIHGEDFDRKILVNDNGMLSTADAHISYQERTVVKLATTNRVFVQNPDEQGTFKLDEYDVATGTKVRTILTGVPRAPRHMVASVLSNGVEVFCTISAGAGSTQNVIQSFLL